MGCEKYNCDCGAIESALNEYNSAVESLSAAINPASVKDKIKGKLQKLEDQLKNIKYSPGAPGSKDGSPCPSCGDKGDLMRALKATIGEASANVIQNCCGPNGRGISDPNGNAFRKPNDGGPDPCGKDSDNQVNASLFPEGCDLFSDDDGETEVQIPKYKCEETPPEKCPNKVQLKLIQDGEVTIKIPLLKSTIDDVNKVFDYIENATSKLNGIQDLGGKNSSLKQESCLVSLLDAMCSSLGSVPVTNNNRGCKGALMSAGFGAKKNAQNACDQLLHEVAYNHTGTYGHVGDMNPNHGPGDWVRSPNGGGDGIFTPNPTPDENGKNPKCSDNDRVRTETTVFVPAGGDVGATVNEKLDQLQKDHPGCQDSGVKVDRTGAPQPCGGALGDCDCLPAKPNEMTDEDRKKIEPLQATIKAARAKEDEISAAIKTKQTELDLLTDPPPPTPPLVLTDAQKQRRDQLKKAIEEDTKAYVAAQKQGDDAQQELNAILQQAGTKNLVGSCVKFQYSYCPAKSTPKQGKGGNQGGGKTRRKETDHSNFFDLVRNIKQATDLPGIGGCGSHNPLGDAINDCFGNQEGPRPDSGNGPDDGPTVAPNAPCSENDSVQQIPSNGPCNASNPDNDYERRDCVKKLANIAQGLAKEIKNSGLSDRRNGIISSLSQIASKLEAIGPAMQGISLPGGEECSGWNANETIEKINKVTEQINSVMDQIDQLNI